MRWFGWCVLLGAVVLGVAGAPSWLAATMLGVCLLIADVACNWFQRPDGPH